MENTQQMKLTVQVERATSSRNAKVAKEKLNKDLCCVTESLNFHANKLAYTSTSFDRKLQLARDDHLLNKRKMQDDHRDAYAVWSSKTEDKKQKLTNAVKELAAKESSIQLMQTKMNLATKELKEQYR